MLHELPLGHLQSPRSFIKIIASKAVRLAASIETSTRWLARILSVRVADPKARPATSRVDHDVVAVRVQEPDCGYARSANRESAISDETRFGLSLDGVTTRSVLKRGPYPGFTLDNRFYLDYESRRTSGAPEKQRN